MYTRSRMTTWLLSRKMYKSLICLWVALHRVYPGYRDQKSVSARSRAIIAPAEEATKHRFPATITNWQFNTNFREFPWIELTGSTDPSLSRPGKHWAEGRTATKVAKHLRKRNMQKAFNFWANLLFFFYHLLNEGVVFNFQLNLYTFRLMKTRREINVLV